MNIREFTRPASSKKLNESLAKKFGAKIDIDRFTTEQLPVSYTHLTLPTTPYV